VNDDELPAALRITARNAAGLPMAMRHNSLPHVGVQFHPESVLTPEGPIMLANWLNEVAAFRLLHPVRSASVPVWKVEE
jgi:anthranilate synthase component 2